MSIPSGFIPVEEYEASQKSIQEQPDGIPEGFSPKDETPLSAAEKVRGVGQHYGRAVLSEVMGSPKTISDFVKFGSNWMAQKGVEQKLKKGEKLEPERLKKTQTILKGLGFPSELLEKIKYPSPEEWNPMIKSFYEKFGGEQAPVEPRNPAEKRAKTIGGYTGASLIGGLKTLPERLLYGTIGGAGAAEVEARGGGTGAQLGVAIGLPALISIASQIKSGKFRPSSEHLKNLKAFGEEIGLTEGELTAILQSEGKTSFFSKAAKPTKESIAKFGSIEGKLGEAYDAIRANVKGLPPATVEQTTKLIGEFDGIVKQLKKSAMPGDDKLAAIKKIEEAGVKIANEGLGFEGIMETYFDVNRTVNWSAYKGGKKDLAKIKQPLKDLAKEISPIEGRNFEKVTELYHRFKQVEKSIGIDQYKKIANYGKYYATLGAITSEMATGNFKAIPATLGAFLGVELSQRLATKMLTDPKYQNIAIKAANAVKSGSRATGMKVFGELRDQLIDDFPEMAKDVDWKDLQKDTVLDRFNRNQ